MLIPAAVITLLVVAAAAVFALALRGMRNGHGTHIAGMPYIPTTNPFRIGSTILVCEDPARPEMNWYGTLLSTRGGVVTVRDSSAPFHTVDLEREYVWPADTNLGW
jgi:hypothetical protein